MVRTTAGLWGLLACAILALIPAAAPPRAAQASVLLGLHRAETSIAVDPRAPRTMVVAANPTYRFNAKGQEPIGVFVTHDGGAHWAAMDVPMAPPFVVGSDPSVAFAADGTLYVGFEAVSGGFCGSASTTAVMVARSTDGGRSFGSPVVVDVNPDNDKPYLAAGSHNAVYVSWIRFYANTASQVAFAASTDGGLHFSAPRLISAGSGLHIAPMPAAGPGEQVAVAWLAYTGTIGATVTQHIETRTSFDNGLRFGAVAHTTSFLGLPGLEQPGSLRLFNGPSLAIADQRRMYVAWEQQHPGRSPSSNATDIMLSRSTDGGRYWSAPIALSDSARADRFEPQIAVAAGGYVVAAFYDRRRDGVNLDLEFAVARDAGRDVRLWPNLRLTPLPAPIAAIPFIPPGSPCLAQGRFFGDYLGLATRDGQAEIAWTVSSSAYPGQTQIRYLAAPIAPTQGRGAVHRWRAAAGG